MQVEIRGRIFVRGDNDKNHGRQAKDLLHVEDGAMIRPRAKRIKEAMQGLIQAMWTEISSATSNTQNFKLSMKEEPSLVHLIRAKENEIFSKAMWLQGFNSM